MSLEHLPHLFVEGKTDRYVVVQLLKSYDIFAQDGDARSEDLKKLDTNKVQVVVKVIKPNADSSGSKSELLSDLEQRIKRPTHSAIGYVFDADDPAHAEPGQSLRDLQSTWQAICTRLVSLPLRLVPDETIPVAGFVGNHGKLGTPIGVWLMPDNQRDGSLEDFLRELIDEADKLAPFAETSTRAAKDDHGATFGEKDFKKAAIETWLAWQEEPGMTFGTAFQKNCLQKNKPLGERFVAWVRKLIAAPQTS